MLSKVWKAEVFFLKLELVAIPRQLTDCLVEVDCQAISAPSLYTISRADQLPTRLR